MIDLFFWLFIGGIIGMIVLHGWPILVIAATVTAGVWTVNRIAATLRADLQRHHDRLAAIIARADTQHHQILSGDETGGTYGEYQPPPALR